MAIVPYIAAGALSTLSSEVGAFTGAGLIRTFGVSSLALLTQGGALTSAGAAGNTLTTYPVEHNNQIQQYRPSTKRSRPESSPKKDDQTPKKPKSSNKKPPKQTPPKAIKNAARVQTLFPKKGFTKRRFARKTRKTRRKYAARKKAMERRFFARQ